MFRLGSCMRLIGTMMVSDRTRQKQRGGFWSTNFQAYKIEIHPSGMRESAVPDITRSDPEAHIGDNGWPDAIRERVLELLNRHGIDPPTMAEILDVPLSMLGRRDELLDRLDNPTLDRLTNLFCVNRDWFVGQNPCPNQYEKKWYNDTVGFVQHILELEKQSLRPVIYFMKPDQMNADDAMEAEGAGYRVGISITRTHKTSSGKSFRTFEPWSWEPWNYQKSRIDFLSIYMILDRTWRHQLEKDMTEVGMPGGCCWDLFNRFDRIKYRAMGVDEDTIGKYRNCKIFLKELIDSSSARGPGWSPDVFTDRLMVRSRIRPEIKFIEERYFEILKALAHDVRWSR